MSLALFNPVNLVAKAISRGMSPKQAAQLQIPLDFSQNSSYKVQLDMSQHVRSKWGIAGIRSVKFDNSNNPQTVALTFDNGDTLTLPPYAQGILPVLFSGEVLSFIASSSGNVLLLLTFLNTREQAQIWAINSVLQGAVNVSGSTVYTFPVAATRTDKSGSIAVGGTSQQAAAANALRKRFIIMNPASAAGQGTAGTESLFFNFADAAGINNGTSFELVSGATYDSSGGPVSTDAINVNGATTGHKFIMKEFN